MSDGADGRPIPPPPAIPRPAIASETPLPAATPIAELLATGAIERVDPNPAGARVRLRDAAAHLRTARGNLDDDPRGAVSLAHEASRKAITARMLVDGLRPTGGESGHRHVVDYATAELPEVVETDDLDALERLRRTRNQANYGDDAAVITVAHAELALATAGRVVDGITAWFRSNHPSLAPPASPPDQTGR